MMITQPVNPKAQMSVYVFMYLVWKECKEAYIGDEEQSRAFVETFDRNKSMDVPPCIARDFGIAL